MLLLLLNHVVLRALWKIDVYRCISNKHSRLYYYYFYYNYFYYYYFLNCFIMSIISIIIIIIIYLLFFLLLLLLLYTSVTYIASRLYVHTHSTKTFFVILLLYLLPRKPT